MRRSWVFSPLSHSVALIGWDRSDSDSDSDLFMEIDDEMIYYAP